MKQSEILATLLMQYTTNEKITNADCTDREDQIRIARSIDRRLIAARKANPAGYKKAAAQYSEFLDLQMEQIYKLYVR